MRSCWLDVRHLAENREAILEEAVHQRVDAIMAADPAVLKDLPPTVRRVLFSSGTELEDAGDADVVIVDELGGTDPSSLAARFPGVEVGRYVEIVDADSLQRACDVAATDPWCVLTFRDPTKIPLEIVLAAADKAGGTIITTVEDTEEAGIVFGVLEHGSDGVMLSPRKVGDATELRQTAAEMPGTVDLVELEITEIRHIGMGERACVDTCSHFRTDEGILVGSRSHGMILACSETHPLPYMPTRPFRVNAGALHSYAVAVNGRTNYLSELRVGSKILAVDSKGQSRAVLVGRVKIETRPLLAIDAVGPNGQGVDLVVQDDWHVRVLGPGGVVLNVTELKPGDKVLGHLPTEQRHVGYAIDEFCIEQ